MLFLLLANRKIWWQKKKRNQCQETYLAARYNMNSMIIFYNIHFFFFLFTITLAGTLYIHSPLFISCKVFIGESFISASTITYQYFTFTWNYSPHLLLFNYIIQLQYPLIVTFIDCLKLSSRLCLLQCLIL